MPKLQNEIAKKLYESLTTQVELQQQTVSDTLGLLVLNISEGCNLKCTYCFADRGCYGKSKTKWMTPEIAVASTEAVIEKYKQIKAVKFFGGEPFLNLDAIEAVSDYLHGQVSRGKLDSMPHISAITNLTIFNERALALVQRFNIHLTAAIDGPQPVHDAFRIFNNGSGSFEVINQNIHLWRKRCGQPTILEATYGPRHLELEIGMSDVVKFLQDTYNIFDIILHPMEPYPPANHLISARSWQRFRELIYELAMDYGKYEVRRSFSNNQAGKIANYFMRMADPIQKDAHCDVGIDTITVSAEGKVFPCYTFMGFEEFMMAENCTFEALMGKKFRKIQTRFLKNRKSNNPICAECDILKTCRQCPGEMVHQTGSINATIPTACNYLIGFVEGMLIGLNDAKMNNEYWEAFMKNITSK